MMDEVDRERRRLVACREKSDEAQCINCGWPVSDHLEIALYKPEICAPPRICPTALFKVTLETLTAAIAADLAEDRAKAGHLREKS